ncbi:MAG: hypothetical protein HY393_04390 [Candidatus Diapherotrites archaeon]|nr:hypothetical protein [Candidatus Diapherotrites archaeon]
MSDTITVEAKKWGNSISLIVDNEVVKRQKIHPLDKLLVTVQKIDALKTLRGTFPRKKPTQELMDEIRKGWG